MTSSDSKKSIKFIVVFVLLIFASILFSACKSVFNSVNGSPKAVMNTYGRYCAAVYNNSKCNDKDLLKLCGGIVEDAKSQKAMVYGLKSTLPQRRGEITFAIMKRPITNGNKVMCGVMFYDKKSNKIYYEHVILLEKQPSGEYEIDGVVVNASGRNKDGTSNKKLYQ